MKSEDEERRTALMAAAVGTLLLLATTFCVGLVITFILIEAGLAEWRWSD